MELSVKEGAAISCNGEDFDWYGSGVGGEGQPTVLSGSWTL